MEFILVTEFFYCSQKIMDNGLKFLALQTLKQRQKTFLREFYLTSSFHSSPQEQRHR